MEFDYIQFQNLENSLHSIREEYEKIIFKSTMGEYANASDIYKELNEKHLEDLKMLLLWENTSITEHSIRKSTNGHTFCFDMYKSPGRHTPSFSSRKDRTTYKRLIVSRLKDKYDNKLVKVSVSVDDERSFGYGQNFNIKVKITLKFGYEHITTADEQKLKIYKALNNRVGKEITEWLSRTRQQPTTCFDVFVQLDKLNSTDNGEDGYLGISVSKAKKKDRYSTNNESRFNIDQDYDFVSDFIKDNPLILKFFMIQVICGPNHCRNWSEQITLLSRKTRHYTILDF